MAVMCAHAEAMVQHLHLYLIIKMQFKVSEFVDGYSLYQCYSPIAAGGQDCVGGKSRLCETERSIHI